MNRSSQDLKSPLLSLSKEYLEDSCIRTLLDVVDDAVVDEDDELVEEVVCHSLGKSYS